MKKISGEIYEVQEAVGDLLKLEEIEFLVEMKIKQIEKKKEMAK